MKNIRTLNFCVLDWDVVVMVSSLTVAVRFLYISYKQTCDMFWQMRILSYMYVDYGPEVARFL